MNVLVIGGTGVISSCIVNQLVEKQANVSIMNRGKSIREKNEKVRYIFADRHDIAAFSKVCEESSYDVVVDMICFNEEDARQTVNLFKGKTDQIIICSTVSVYKRPYLSIPANEDEELLNTDPSFPYSYNKVKMELYLREQIAQDVPITIVRPSLTFGEGTRNLGTFRQNYNIVDRIIKGKPLVMFNDGHHPWTYSFAPDVASAIVSLIGVKKAIGQTFHVTSDEYTVWEDLYLEFGKLLGVEPQMVCVPSKTLYKANPDLCAHLYFEKSYAGIFDNSKRYNTVGKKIPCSYNLVSGVKLVYDSWIKDGLQVDESLDRYEDLWVDKIRKFEDSVTTL